MNQAMERVVLIKPSFHVYKHGYGLWEFKKLNYLVFVFSN